MAEFNWNPKMALTRAKAADVLAQVPGDACLRFSLLVPHALLDRLGVQPGNPPMGGAAKSFYSEASQTLDATDPKELERLTAGDPGTCTIIEYINSHGQRCRKMVCYDELGNEHVVWDVCEA